MLLSPPPLSLAVRYTEYNILPGSVYCCLLLFCFFDAMSMPVSLLQKSLCDCSLNDAVVSYNRIDSTCCSIASRAEYCCMLCFYGKTKQNWHIFAVTAAVV